jgi:hypothetical protein
MSNVVPLRPAVPSHSVPVPPSAVLVSVEWDDARALYVAACDGCCETATTHHLTDAETWADEHRCDPELAALLATVLHGIAA